MTWMLAGDSAMNGKKSGPALGSVDTTGYKGGAEIGLSFGNRTIEDGIVRPMAAERRYEARGVSERDESCCRRELKAKRSWSSSW